jgi:hypothetical protein
MPIDIKTAALERPVDEIDKGMESAAGTAGPCRYQINPPQNFPDMANSFYSKMQSAAQRLSPRHWCDLIRQPVQKALLAVRNPISSWRIE